MTGKDALEMLKQMEKDGTLDDVLALDIITKDDVIEWVNAVSGLDDAQKDKAKAILADRMEAERIVETAVEETNPYGEDFFYSVYDQISSLVDDDEDDE